MKSIFFNKFNQLRSGWKIFCVLFMTVFINYVLRYFIGVHSILIMFTSSKFKSLGIGEDKALQLLLESPMRSNLLSVSFPLALIIAVYAGIKLLDRVSLRNTGFILSKRTLIEFLIGLLFGAVSISIVFLLLFKSGNITFEKSPSLGRMPSSLLWGLIFFTLVGVSEELFSRGYTLMVLGQTGVKWIPPVVSSMIFALLHVSNPNIKPLGIINVFLIGMLFAYMVIKTGNIMMAAGYHITWNFFMGNIFGLSVSGVDMGGIYKSKVVGDNLISGGAFGPEAGILTTAVILLGWVSIWGYGYFVSRRKQKKTVQIISTQ